MPILTYVRSKKATVVRIRHIEIHNAFHLKSSDLGSVKFGVTPGGGLRAGCSPGVVAMLGDRTSCSKGRLISDGSKDQPFFKQTPVARTVGLSKLNPKIKAESSESAPRYMNVFH